jgi:hypothetical protein
LKGYFAFEVLKDERQSVKLRVQLAESIGNDSAGQVLGEAFVYAASLSPALNHF